MLLKHWVTQFSHLKNGNSDHPTSYESFKDWMSYVAQANWPDLGGCDLQRPVSQPVLFTLLGFCTHSLSSGGIGKD